MGFKTFLEFVCSMLNFPQQYFIECFFKMHQFLRAVKWNKTLTK